MTHREKISYGARGLKKVNGNQPSHSKAEVINNHFWKGRAKCSRRAMLIGSEMKKSPAKKGIYAAKPTLHVAKPFLARDEKKRRKEMDLGCQKKTEGKGIESLLEFAEKEKQ